jgi:hypothetical protein
VGLVAEGAIRAEAAALAATADVTHAQPASGTYL